MDDYNFDTEAFINEIKEHECIWNYKCELYSDRIMKNYAWLDICEKYSENFQENTSTDENKIPKFLQNRWKVIRDGYTRYVRKIMKNQQSGQAPTNKTRKYIYFNQLSFLAPLAEERANTVAVDSWTEERDDKNQVEFHVEDYVIPLPSSRGKRKASAIKEEQVCDPIHPNIVNGAGVNDDDKLFLLSLHGDLKKIADEFKIDAKMEIMTLIKRYKEYS